MNSTAFYPDVAYPWLAERTTEFPDSDGKPMADNTDQYDWISIIKWGLETQYNDDPNVFVASDHLIYPDPTNDKIRQAPDVYVAFGRPKMSRGSYKVFREEGIFPQVVFEVWSPSNR
jgi:Uma2 family endonuclease